MHPGVADVPEDLQRLTAPTTEAASSSRPASEEPAAIPKP
jgi:hypothetical protein